MSTRSESLRLADSLVKHLKDWPDAWPDRSPYYALTDNAAILCHQCCERERFWIGNTTGTDGWCVTSVKFNEGNQNLFCDQCSKQIDSAYPYPND